MRKSLINLDKVYLCGVSQWGTGGGCSSTRYIDAENDKYTEGKKLRSSTADGQQSK
jgi:hypothetical protein